MNQSYQKYTHYKCGRNGCGVKWVDMFIKHRTRNLRISYGSTYMCFAHKVAFACCSSLWGYALTCRTPLPPIIKTWRNPCSHLCCGGYTGQCWFFRPEPHACVVESEPGGVFVFSDLTPVLWRAYRTMCLFVCFFRPHACVVEGVPGTYLELWTECRYWTHRKICGQKT